MDFHQLWTIVSTPDNVPIVLLLFVVPFYTWYGLRQSFANDRLIAQLEADPEMAKTHHRKTQPWRPEWAREVHVWPYLLRIEFLAAIIVTVILMVWSITLNAPLEEPANPTLTMNPSKAPWYFLGLQEMLVYFDPWMAGVVMPSLIIIGLMVIPYIDANPLGNGYYTFKQRKFAILTFIFGFIVLWVSMIVIGTMIRGPGMDVVLAGHHVGPQPADLRGQPRPAGYLRHHRPRGQDHLRRHGGGRILASARAFVIHKLMTRTPFNRKIYARMSVLQYVTMQIFLVIMLSLPVKILVAPVVPYQVRLGDPLVQHMSDQEKDPVVHSSLSRPLFIWSALLVLSLIWGLYDEMYGIRPWKGYQARFEKLYSRYLKTARSGRGRRRTADQGFARLPAARPADAGGGEGRHAGGVGHRQTGQPGPGPQDPGAQRSVPGSAQPHRLADLRNRGVATARAARTRCASRSRS